jgi:hypothetical protein
MTLTLMRSTKGKVACGYLHNEWKIGGFSGTYGTDEEEFLLSVKNLLKIRPTDCTGAVNIFCLNGPSFGNCSF